MQQWMRRKKNIWIVLVIIFGIVILLVIPIFPITRTKQEPYRELVQRQVDVDYSMTQSIYPTWGGILKMEIEEGVNVTIRNNDIAPGLFTATVSFFKKGIPEESTVDRLVYTTPPQSTYINPGQTSTMAFYSEGLDLFPDLTWSMKEYNVTVDIIAPKKNVTSYETRYRTVDYPDHGSLIQILLGR